MKKLYSIVFLFSFFLHLPLQAHPGRTASDGCHYCRTNCSSWGVAWNQRHCHGGYSPPPPSSFSTSSYVAPKTQSCPYNSTYSLSKSKCICDEGYADSLDNQTCIKIPDNAHAVQSPTDVWMCDKGYREVKDSCVSTNASDKNNGKENNAEEVIVNSDMTNNTRTNSEESSGGTIIVMLIIGLYVYLKRKKELQD